jgi:hypothetical protein
MRLEQDHDACRIQTIHSMHPSWVPVPIMTLETFDTYNWITPLCNEAQTQGRTGWKAKPFTRADLLSNLVNMVDCCNVSCRCAATKSSAGIGILVTGDVFGCFARLLRKQDIRPTSVRHLWSKRGHPPVFWEFGILISLVEVCIQPLDLWLRSPKIGE